MYRSPTLGGVKRVVIGADDPNPTVRGDGASALEKSDVEVESGLLVEECGQQMRNSCIGVKICVQRSIEGCN